MCAGGFRDHGSARTTKFVVRRKAQCAALAKALGWHPSSHLASVTFCDANGATCQHCQGSSEVPPTKRSRPYVCCAEAHAEIFAGRPACRLQADSNLAREGHALYVVFLKTSRSLAFMPASATGGPVSNLPDCPVRCWKTVASTPQPSTRACGHRHPRWVPTILRNNYGMSRQPFFNQCVAVLKLRACVSPETQLSPSRFKGWPSNKSP